MDPADAQRGRRGGRRGHALRGLDLVRPAARRGARRSTSRARARSSRFAREAKDAGRLDRFIHVSTAYVAGITKGTFRERQLDAGQEFRNTYEQTKWEAEHVVNDASDLDPVIARPSIVMGESSSGWTPAFNVLYWPIRAFSRGLFDEVPARPEALVDVVPVDYVADALVHLLEDTSSSGVVNLVSRPRGLHGRRPGRDDRAPRSARSARPWSRPARPAPAPPTPTTRPPVYFPYFDMDMVFDDSRARALLGPAGIRCPHLTDYFPRLIEYAQTTRWGKTPLTREEAAAAHARRREGLPDRLPGGDPRRRHRPDHHRRRRAAGRGNRPDRRRRAGRARQRADAARQPAERGRRRRSAAAPWPRSPLDDDDAPAAARASRLDAVERPVRARGAHASIGLDLLGDRGGRAAAAWEPAEATSSASPAGVRASSVVAIGGVARRGRRRRRDFHRRASAPLQRPLRGLAAGVRRGRGSSTARH